MPPELKPDEYYLSAINTDNKVIDVLMGKCQHCNQPVPKVGICSDCKTPYDHTKTVENPETGYIHYIYECSGCEGNLRKAQKIIKVNDGNGRKEKDETATIEASLKKGFY